MRNGDVLIEVRYSDEGRSKLSSAIREEFGWGVTSRTRTPHRGRGAGSRHNDGRGEGNGRRKKALQCNNDKRGPGEHYEEGLQGMAEGLRGVKLGAGGMLTSYKTPRFGECPVESGKRRKLPDATGFIATAINCHT